MQYDVIVYGPIFCDLIFTDLPGLPALGTEIFAGDLTVTVGGSAIVAAGLHRLGARVGLAADLGTDAFSGIMRQTLDKLGLDRSLIREHDHPLPQATVGLSFPQDRAFVTHFARPRTPPDLARLLRDHPAKHLHVCSFLAALDNPRAAHIAHAAGVTVSMDPGWDETALRNPQLAGMIREVDFFLPSEMEMRHIAAEDDLLPAAAKVASTMRQDATLVVKQGANGATAFVNGGCDAFHTSVLPVTPVDTTGAGDSFDAGFLYAFVNGLSLDECMRYGAVCGGLSTTGPGGIGALPTLSEVESWLPKLPSSAAAAPTRQD
ncbi:hypothetical protein GC175_29525 [bacterium]|nr:hypothetical protein [bacterium]